MKASDINAVALRVDGDMRLECKLMTVRYSYRMSGIRFGEPPLIEGTGEIVGSFCDCGEAWFILWTANNKFEHVRVADCTKT